MIVTVKNESPFQILSSSFSIGPSETGYDLQVGADSRNFTTLFSVGANTPRMVTNVANGSYFRLKNNVGDVKVNWQRVCTDDGGGGASGTELQPVADFPLNAVEGTVISYTGSSSASGIYQFDGTDWVEAGGAIDPSVLEGYATSGDMQSAFTLISETQQVAAAGLDQLEGRIDELSGATPDLSAYYTSAQTEAAIAQAVSGLATEQYVQDALSGVNMDNYWTSAETKNYVDDKVVSAETQVAQSFANLDTNVIQPMQGDIQELSGITEEIQDNFSAYTPTTGFSTINGSAITNGGNIVIEGGADMSAYYTSAQTENAITSKNYVTSAQVETQIVSKNYITSAETANFVTSAQVETQITSKGYATVSQIPTVPTSNTAFTNDAGYITSAAIADKVSSTYVSTIWKGTAAEYEAITVKDPTTFYIIVEQ